MTTHGNELKAGQNGSVGAASVKTSPQRTRVSCIYYNEYRVFGQPTADTASRTFDGFSAGALPGETPPPPVISPGAFVEYEIDPGMF